MSFLGYKADDTEKSTRRALKIILDLVKAHPDMLENSDLKTFEKSPVYSQAWDGIYDFDWHSESAFSRGKGYEEQKRFIDDVHNTLSQIKSIKDIYNRYPDTAMHILSEIERYRTRLKTDGSVKFGRAADLLGVYCLQDGFPSIDDFLHKAGKDKINTNAESVLLLDDDAYMDSDSIMVMKLRMMNADNQEASGSVESGDDTQIDTYEQLLHYVKTGAFADEDSWIDKGWNGGYDDECFDVVKQWVEEQEAQRRA